MKSLPFSRPCASRRVTIALDRPPDLTLDSTCLDRVPRSRSRLPACLLIDSPVSGVGSRLLVCLFVGVRSSEPNPLCGCFQVLYPLITLRCIRVHRFPTRAPCSNVSSAHLKRPRTATHIHALSRISCDVFALVHGRSEAHPDETRVRRCLRPLAPPESLPPPRMIHGGTR